MQRKKKADLLRDLKWVNGVCVEIPEIMHKYIVDCILSQTFLTKEPIYNLTLETNASFTM